MKNYDDITNDLLERRDRYIVHQQTKQKRVMHWAACFGCFCIAALVCVGIWRGGSFNVVQPNPVTPSQTLEDALYPGIKDTFDEKNGESVSDPTANNKIIVHRVTGSISSDMSIALMLDDFVPMTREEMIEYYGMDFIPDVPTDMQLMDTQFGVFKRGGGTGEVYWDQTLLACKNEVGSKSARVNIAKGKMPFMDCIFYDPEMEKSIINNLEVLIGQNENEIYIAEFMHQNVGFMISADGLTEDEFIAIIASIIQ